MKKPNFYLETKKESKTKGVIVIYPLPRGFGNTLGNVLRRSLLSSLEGAAVDYVKINGVTHPFSTVKGLKENVLAFILNLKQLKFKFEGEAEQKLTLKKKEPGEITGADVKDTPLCKVINKDIYLGELAKEANINVELYVNKGVGYNPSEEKEEKEFGVLPLDSYYSPIVNVQVNVERTRVGRKTNYDKLTLTIETDGSLLPSEALQKATRTLIDQFSLILKGGVEIPRVEKKPTLIDEINESGHRDDMMVDELDLPTRVINALIKHGIETVTQLKQMNDQDLAEVRGLGKKSIEELKEKIAEL